MIVYDTVSAMFEGFRSACSRVLLFFFTAVLAHFLAYWCACVGFQESIALWDLVASPVTWFVSFFRAFTYTLGIVFGVLIAGAFVLLAFTELPAGHAATLLFLSQLWNTYIVEVKIVGHWAWEHRWRLDYHWPGHLIFGTLTLLVLGVYAFAIRQRHQLIGGPNQRMHAIGADAEA